MSANRSGHLMHGLQKSLECFLSFGRALALVLLNKMRHPGLYTQRPQILLKSAVIDVGEEECGIDLTLLNVSSEGTGVSDARVSYTVLPDGVNKLGGFPHHARQVGVEAAVEVRLEHQVA